MLAEEPPFTNRCGTRVPMWMNGLHPSLADGEVSRQACGYWGPGESLRCHRSTTIQVRACSGGYFVYKLPKPPFCQLAYCGDDGE
uniref:UMOD/GP2/OIT3-like D8C domain-containing protein n=1 Tax=Branchiostoma floridae TaxID=7739 RepID=C3ZVJ0_BRAFL|eukprot:XP_002587413.1 hypothetical protein BRAFLDRAFT_238518 [Branchiostoma floridae]